MDFAAARLKMIDSQLRTEDVTDYDVLAAMGDVARERFVPEKMQALAYIDEDIAVGPGRSLMRPATFGRLLQALEITPTDKALDVGAGLGGGAAVLARLAASVVALESDPGFAAAARVALAGSSNVTIATGSLPAGNTAGAPYDVIVIEGAVEEVPESLLAQLADGGRLAVVVGRGRAASATLYKRSGGEVSSRPIFSGAAAILAEFDRPKAFVF